MILPRPLHFFSPFQSYLPTFLISRWRKENEESTGRWQRQRWKGQCNQKSTASCSDIWSIQKLLRQILNKYLWSVRNFKSARLSFLLPPTIIRASYQSRDQVSGTLTYHGFLQLDGVITSKPWITQKPLKVSSLLSNTHLGKPALALVPTQRWLTVT